MSVFMYDICVKNRRRLSVRWSRGCGNWRRSVCR